LTSRGGLSGKLLGHVRSLIAAIQQRQADALILTTPAAWNRLPDPETVKQRIHVVPHGLDTQLFSPRPDWDSQESLAAEQAQPSILFFANVVKRKGIHTLVEAFPGVLRDVPNCKLRIAGSGPDISEIKELVMKLGCGEHVEFLGRKERTDAPELYRNCTVYCLPSFGEPYGTTVVEAMSCAKALVVTNCGALPHLVHKEGGLRVPAGDSIALSQALVWLLQHPRERATMGRYNRCFVEEKMPWDSVARQLEDVYEITLSGQSSSGQKRETSLSFGVERGQATR
jgi:L-malate glycosyltransferase